jgi:hypothetical protein
MPGCREPAQLCTIWRTCGCGWLKTLKTEHVLKTRLVSPDDVMLPVVLLSDLPPCRGHFLYLPRLFLRLSLFSEKVALICKLQVLL